MTLWVSSPEVASNTSPTIPIRKSRMTTIGLNINGLMPNSKYTLHVNDVDMSWAAKIPGARMGDPLISDANGAIQVLYMAEMNPHPPAAQVTDKYHTIVLKDIAGNPRATSLIQQKMVGK